LLCLTGFLTWSPSVAFENITGHLSDFAFSDFCFGFVARDPALEFRENFGFSFRISCVDVSGEFPELLRETSAVHGGPCHS